MQNLPRLNQFTRIPHNFLHCRVKKTTSSEANTFAWISPAARERGCERLVMRGAEGKEGSREIKDPPPGIGGSGPGGGGKKASFGAQISLIVLR